MEKISNFTISESGAVNSIKPLSTVTVGIRSETLFSTDGRALAIHCPLKAVTAKSNMTVETIFLIEGRNALFLQN